ncbi:ABC transporter permease [Candidatus Woesearchaeota archaeon]|jgi:putative ABC transport system permease protein|nr:ABC transporter permease [Candidatus Woesearchaeota archaeon]MBT4150884.1 ABC transporter permease [Candidatus Woesearchaeota archaeon]MBT4246897.1 ABC transporter permease [Candidatus Woesearchaeota archaeon]MBT4433674.1 ABC transporter permease [Candidatus Woesearchaeota archaeon]
MIKDYLYIPWNEIKRRRLRAWLTLIGVIIGIAAIVSLITLGQGLQNAIQSQFDALGNDKLFVTAKGNVLTAGLSIDAIKITEKDKEVVARTSGVKRVAGMIYSTGRIEFNELIRYFFISGLPTDPEERALVGESQSYHLLKGRFLEKGDKFKAVLGYAYTQPTLFQADIDLGQKILIQDQEFKIVGFLEKIGSPPDDQSILIPLDAYQDVFDSGDELGIIIAQSQLGEDTLKVGENIEKELRKSRDQKEGDEDFSVATPDQFAETFNIILDIVQAVLVGIAGISLLVGGVGIMNTMYTTVLQRTKEIGVMKSLGAENKHILYLFLVEAGFYGLGGGLIGVTIGFGFAKIVEWAFLIAVGPAFLSVEFNVPLIAGTLLFSFLIGVISGIAPAYRASKLNPVDALRYE